MKESDIIRIWRGYCLGAEVIVDVGSQFGKFTAAADSTAKDATIYAFEPDPHAHGRMKGIGASNGNTIDFQKVALGAEPGRATLWNQNTGCMLAIRESNAPKTEVDVTTLDDAVEYEIDILKIDVEGYETEVLQGATQHLEKCPAILLETHPKFLEQVGRSHCEALSLLKDAGYHISLLWETGNWAGSTHYLCTK